MMKIVARRDRALTRAERADVELARNLQRLVVIRPLGIAEPPAWPPKLPLQTISRSRQLVPRPRFIRRRQHWVRGGVRAEIDAGRFHFAHLFPREHTRRADLVGDQEDRRG